MQTQTGSAALRVLLVDDDSIALELVSLLLAGEGTEISRAPGGEEALKLLDTIINIYLGKS